MTEAQMREVVSSTFDTAWRAVHPTVPLVLDNEARSSETEFAILVITPTTSQQMTTGRVGTRRVRRNGWLQVQVYADADQGAARSSVLIDAAVQIIEMTSFPSPIAGEDPVTTQASIAGGVIWWAGADGELDGRWYKRFIRVPFWYCETK